MIIKNYVYTVHYGIVRVSNESDLTFESDDLLSRIDMIARAGTELKNHLAATNRTGNYEIYAITVDEQRKKRVDEVLLVLSPCVAPGTRQ